MARVAVPSADYVLSSVIADQPSDHSSGYADSFLMFSGTDYVYLPEALAYGGRPFRPRRRRPLRQSGRLPGLSNSTLRRARYESFVHQIVNPGICPDQTANLLTYTQATDNAAWTKTNCTSVDGATDPVSGTAAETVTATSSNATLTQSQTLPAGLTPFRLSKTKDRDGGIHFRGWSTWVVKAITGSWTRWETNLSISAGTATPGIKIATNADAVYVYGAQLGIRQ